MMLQGDASAAARRPGALPRSISDISETHSLQAYASLRDHGSATDVSSILSSAYISHGPCGLADHLNTPWQASSSLEDEMSL